MEFHGRKEQLESIHREIISQHMSVVMIYGRRRVGKSELIKQTLKNEKLRSIYYECKQTTEMNNVKSLSAILSETFDLPKLGFTGIEELLEYIFTLSENEKIIFVLDEYSFLRSAVKGLDSIIQSLVDKYRNRSLIKFFLLGSYVDTMKELLDHSNPLYGRIDKIIHLKPMDYYESALFYPGFSDENKVRIFSVFGGIPYYNSLIDDSLTVQENITELIASPGARLENEVIMYLKTEIAKMINANEVFEVLAQGFSRFSDILTKSHVSSAPTLADVLEKLIKMEVIRKEAPINDENNRKKTGYMICDNLSLFYYRYVFRFASQMNIMNPLKFYEKYIAEDFEFHYIPLQFEEICKQYLIRENITGNIDPVIEKIGKYYYDDPVTHKNGEFDIVTQDEKGYVFYEVKFKNRPITTSVMLQEIAQVRACGLDCYKHGFFSRSGFEEKELPNINYFELSDLYR